MRRIFLVIAILVVVGIAGFFLLRPKSSQPASGRAGRGAAGDDETAESGSRRSRGRGRVSGRLQPQSKAETKAERKKLRKEERLRRREQKLRERELRRQTYQAGRVRRGRRRSSGRRGRKGQMYSVGAIVSLGSESYALVDGRRVAVGDVIMGRRIVEITPDRVVIDAFGRRSSVRVGQSIVPMTASTGRSRRR